MVQKEESRRRGRPRSYDPGAALNAARDAFWRQGYSGTSLDDLSEATGMNRPSLYAAFGDKRSIYLAALRQQAEGMLRSTRAALSQPADLRETLKAFYFGAVGIYVGDREKRTGCFLVGTALADALADDEVRTILRDSFDAMDHEMSARFARAVEAGDLPKDADVAALTFTAMSQLHGLAIRSRAGYPRETLEGWAGMAADAVCGQRNG